MASIWGLVALALADEEFLPFNYLSYAIELQVHLNPMKIMISLAIYPNSQYKCLVVGRH